MYTSAMPSKKGSSIRQILKLSVSERLLAVEEIWDSIASHPELVPITKTQKRELNKRLKAASQDSKSGDSWDNVRNRVQKHYSK